MNGFPKLSPSSEIERSRLDFGVQLFSRLIICGLLVSAIGFLVPAINHFLLPRFGSIGLILGANPLIFIHQWARNPTRSSLLIASSMTLMVGLLNGWLLLKIGTVDVVQNVYLERIHTAWFWSVATYLTAGIYMAIVAFRYQADSVQAHSHEKLGTG